MALMLARGVWAEAPPDGAVVKEVRVEGTKRVPPIEISRAMELREGQPYTEAARQRDLQAVSNTGKIDPLALDITAEKAADGRAVVTVQVKENPVIHSIQITGNVKYSQKQLLNQLGYKVGDVTQTGVRASTQRNLASFYKNGGFKDVRVTVNTQAAKDNADANDLFIVIDERKRIKIKKVILNGNTHFNSFFLEQKLTNSPGLLFFNNYFDELALDEDIAILRMQYENAGYLDAKVSRGAFIYNEEKQDLTLVFDVTEGPRYFVNNVGTEGVSYFTKSEVDRVAGRIEGKRYNGVKLQRTIDDVKRMYGDEGYIDTEVSYRLDKNSPQKKTDIVLTAQESDVAYVGDVRLNMEDYDYNTDVNAFNKMMNWFAPPTKQATVMKEVRLKSGEKYRAADEVRTIERLKNLGIFRKVEVAREPTSDPNVKDAVLNIEEDPNAAFLGVSAGIGEVSGPTITLQATQPNWGGEANRASASATFGPRTMAFRLGYFDRYLGDSKTSLDTSLYYQTDRFRAYQQRVLGGEFEFGRPLNKDERLMGYLRTRAEYVSFSNYSKKAHEDFSSYPVLAERPMLAYDKRDNIKWPTRGYFVSGGLEAGMASGPMLKLLHAYEWYHRFGKSDLVYAYQHTVGLMPYDATNIGISERFFAGGSSNLRGFKYREVGPRDSGDKNLAIGGATRITQRHELRYPFNDFLKGRIFTDAAILEQGPLQAGRPRVGSGVGLIMDIGPVVVEVDFGVPVLKSSGDVPQFFNLKIGSDF